MINSSNNFYIGESSWILKMHGWKYDKVECCNWKKIMWLVLLPLCYWNFSYRTYSIKELLLSLLLSLSFYILRLVDWSFSLSFRRSGVKVRFIRVLNDQLMQAFISAVLSIVSINMLHNRLGIACFLLQFICEFLTISF